MVRREGQQNGIGIWDVEGHERLVGRVHDAFDEFTSQQDFLDPERVDLCDIYVFGSYGNGDGVPGKSDLDLTVTTWYMGDIRSNDYSQFMQHFAGHLIMADVIAGFSEFTELDSYVYPSQEEGKFLYDIASHEPVDTYYDLSSGEKCSFF